MNHLMRLHYWIPSINTDEINFDLAPFWIQIHNLPMEFLNATNGTTILNEDELAEYQAYVLSRQEPRAALRKIQALAENNGSGTTTPLCLLLSPPIQAILKRHQLDPTEANTVDAMKIKYYMQNAQVQCEDCSEEVADNLNLFQEEEPNKIKGKAPMHVSVPEVVLLNSQGKELPTNAMVTEAPPAAGTVATEATSGHNTNMEMCHSSQLRCKGKVPEMTDIKNADTWHKLIAQEEAKILSPLNGGTLLSSYHPLPRTILWNSHLRRRAIQWVYMPSNSLMRQFLLSIFTVAYNMAASFVFASSPLMAEALALREVGTSTSRMPSLNRIVKSLLKFAGKTTLESNYKP